MTSKNGTKMKRILKITGWLLVIMLIGSCANFYVIKQDDYYRPIEEQQFDDLITDSKGFSTPLERAGWTLAWNDEFEKDVLDSTYWNYEVNGDGGGNNELQYYTARKANVWVRNNMLYLKADKEGYKGKNYTSGRINTKGKKDFLYGRFDIRAKLPIQQGIWPAIWMLPTDYVYGGWPQSGEIDIMEALGHEPKKIYGTIHYGDPWPNNQHTGQNVLVAQGDLSTEFHVFSVEWKENEIKWFLDDVLFFTATPKDISKYKWPFDEKFHILLNLAVGGQWPGNPDESTQFPKYMFVDYVRVYQKTSN